MSKLMNEHDVSVLEVRDKCISIGIKATKIIIIRRSRCNRHRSCGRQI